MYSCSVLRSLRQIPVDLGCLLAVDVGIMRRLGVSHLQFKVIQQRVEAKLDVGGHQIPPILGQFHCTDPPTVVGQGIGHSEPAEDWLEHLVPIICDVVSNYREGALLVEESRQLLCV